MASSPKPGLIRSAPAHARDRGDQTAQPERPATAARALTMGSRQVGGAPAGTVQSDEELEACLAPG